MVLTCTCKNGPNGVKTAAAYQDAEYGENKRVHTPMAKGGTDDRKYRCTLCRTERSKGTSGSDAAKSKKDRKTEESQKKQK